MIHKYNMNGYNIVIDVNGGAVHVVDDVTYRVLDFYEDKNLEEIVELLSNEFDRKKVEESYKEIEELVKEGLLYTEDEYEFHPSFVNREPVIKALCLNVAHDCNLKCKYCFAKQGDFGGNAELMPLEIGKKAMDFLVANSGNRRNLDVDFFGGEPLMNWEVVKELVKYGREIEKPAGKNMRFTITTNGVLLDDEKIDFINEHMHNVVLSLDGRKEINDNMRLTVNDKGSYDVIVPKFQKLVSQRPKDKYYYVRGTFTGANTDFYEDVKAMVNEGFREISIEPVVLEKGHFLELKEEHLPEIFENYDKLYNEMARRKKEGDEFNFYHFNIDLNGGPCVYKRISGCGAGFEYVAITPQGEVYPCHQFVGREEYKLGSIYDDTYDAELGKKFKKAHIYNKPKCRECWARFYCSGGCQSNNFAFNGDMNIPYEIGCKMQKKRIECAIALKAE